MSSDLGSRDHATGAIAAAALAFAIGLGAILAAWAFQLIGGYLPCQLCYQERIPYYLGLPPLALGLWLAANGRLRGFARGLLLLSGVVFTAGFALGGYHAGAEWGFWPGPSDCGGGMPPAASADDLLGQIRSTRLVSCTEASFRLFGLSFAGWNVVASATVAVLAFVGARNLRRG